MTALLRAALWFTAVLALLTWSHTSAVPSDAGEESKHATKQAALARFRAAKIERYNLLRQSRETSLRHWKLIDEKARTMVHTLTQEINLVERELAREVACLTGGSVSGACDPFADMPGPVDSPASHPDAGTARTP